MYNTKDIQFVGKHDYDKGSSLGMANYWSSFSVGIFKWELKSNGNEMKRGKCLVRVKGLSSMKDKVFAEADIIVKALDSGNWDGRKKIIIK